MSYLISPFFFFFFLIREGKIGKERKRKKPQKPIPGKPKCDSINFYGPKQVFFCYSNGVGDFFFKLKTNFYVTTNKNMVMF